MNITIVTSSFPLSNRETFLRQEIDEISSMVNQVYIIPLSGDRKIDIKRLKLPNNVKVVGVESKRAYCLKFLRFFTKNPLVVAKDLYLILKDRQHAIRNFFAYLRAISVFRYFKENQCDIDHIHSHWLSTPSTMAYFLSGFLNIPYSITAHRWDIYDNNLPELKGKTAGFIRFISHKGKNDFCERYFCERSLVLHMGVKVPEIDFSYKEIKNRVDIITAANLIEIKGHAVLLDAVEELVKSDIDIRLFFAGEGPLKQEIQNKVNDNPFLMDRVSLLGHVNHDQLLSDYSDQTYQMFVLPSLDLGYGQHEGIPVSLMEAMSYGLTVVGTDAGSVKELVLEGETGFLASPGDSASLAKAIRCALNSDPLVQVKAYNHIMEKFNSLKNSQHLVNLMEESRS